MTIDERLEMLAERHQALTETVQVLAGGEARHEREMAEIRRIATTTRAVLLRAVRLGVREARNERRRRQELDARFELKMDQLASVQLITEEKMQSLEVSLQGLSTQMDRFIDSMRRGGNGNSQSQ
ncbi:MAG: hypothetical protein ACLPY2_27855 [Bryobacteraceae bacterium]|jgi:DNA anti-recombination protein RmuC